MNITPGQWYRADLQKCLRKKKLSQIKESWKMERHIPIAIRRYTEFQTYKTKWVPPTQCVIYKSLIIQNKEKI